MPDPNNPYDLTNDHFDLNSPHARLREYDRQLAEASGQPGPYLGTLPSNPASPVFAPAPAVVPPAVIYPAVPGERPQWGRLLLYLFVVVPLGTAATFAVMFGVFCASQCPGDSICANAICKFFSSLR